MLSAVTVGYTVDYPHRIMSSGAEQISAAAIMDVPLGWVILRLPPVSVVEYAHGQLHVLVPMRKFEQILIGFCTSLPEFVGELLWLVKKKFPSSAEESERIFQHFLLYVLFKGTSPHSRRSP